MKKYLLLIIVVAFSTSTAMAQYYTPYSNPYAQAYERGKRMAEQMMEQQRLANQKAYNRGGAMALVQTGFHEIANGNYEEAVEKFESAYNLNYYPAANCLGVCYELGIGTDRDTDMASLYYEDGAEHGNSDCRFALNRIGKSGYWPESFRATFLKNFRANYAAQYGGSTPSYTAPSYNSGNGSSSSSGRTCISCNGTGKCKTCNGQGWYYPETGYYVGRSGKTRTNCPVCRGTGRCGTCHGNGSIR